MGDKVSAKQAARRVPLIVKETIAEEVRVTGNFLDWKKEGIQLSHDGSGVWRALLRLEPGAYEYRLLVDGEWKDHADATERVANPYGTENCVLKVL